MSDRHVREFLGRSRVHPEKAGPENLVGVATGMYYTPMGGDIMFIEVSASQRNAERQGFRIACPEEIAYNAGWISREQLVELGLTLSKSTYGRYLLKIAEGSN